MSYVILLSGGSGSRLWPLSNDARSKQFLKVLRDEKGNPQSMIQRVFQQVQAMLPDAPIIIAASKNQVPSIQLQLKGSYSLAIEPERRDTAPAIMLACSLISELPTACDQDIVVALPIDAYVDEDFFDALRMLDTATQSNQADLLLLGAKPTHPSEKYGYIVPETSPLNNFIFPVKRFKEKPSESAARKLIEQGALWNCGIFAFRLGYLRCLTARYLKNTSFQSVYDSYQKLPQKSFDYEIVENSTSTAVMPFAGLWKDLGTWNTLTEKMRDKASGNAAFDPTCTNTHIINELNQPLLALGIQNAVIVATQDGILVADKEHSTQMKSHLASLPKTRPMCEKRHWGEYKVIDSASYADKTCCLTKALRLAPGKQISHQRHAYRDEIWTVANGSVDLVVNGIETTLRKGDAASIKAGQKHAARSSEGAEIIEVQLGSSLVEDDIERFGFWWPQNPATLEELEG
ncbi:MAG: sugar phosphate nucleotidyltransferase [Gordonibacter sp.]